MNRSERAQMALLDTAIRQRRAAMADADRRLLAASRRAGFAFRTVAEALAYQDRVREAERVNAARVTMHEQATERRIA